MRGKYNHGCTGENHIKKSLLYFSGQDGWTALHLASQQGHVDVVRVLIAAKAHINQCSKVQLFVNASTISDF